MFTTATGSKVEQSILGSKQRPAASQKWAEKLRGRCAGGLTGCSPHTLGITEEPGSVVRGAWVWISSVVDCVYLVLLNELPFPHMAHETRSPLEDERIKWESTRWANTYSTKCLSFTGHPSLKHRCWSSVWEFLLQDDGFYDHTDALWWVSKPVEPYQPAWDIKVWRPTGTRNSAWRWSRAGIMLTWVLARDLVGVGLTFYKQVVSKKKKKKVKQFALLSLTEL